MNPLLLILRLVHIGGGVFWAGTMFFFVSMLQPSIQDVGPDGAKVMIRLFERGYLNIVPAAALATVVSGVWLLWITSAGFDGVWMGSPIGVAFSTGGSAAIAALVVGIAIIRPTAMRIWAVAKAMPTATDADRAGLLAEMQQLQRKALVAARVVFALLILAVALMAVGRYV